VDAVSGAGGVRVGRALAMGAVKSSANWAEEVSLHVFEALVRCGFGICGSGGFEREWVKVEFLRTTTRNEGEVSNKNIAITRFFIVVRCDNMY
jgi:hypothetical protein